MNHPSDPDRFRGSFPRAGGADELACAGARALLSGYQDGELSSSQASEVRQHLLACPACRELAKDGTHLRSWFERGRPAELDVPEGFAARVARRALAGDPGIVEEDVSWADGSWTSEPVHVLTLGRSAQGRSAQGRSAPRGQLAFLVTLTAVAAAALLAFALVLQRATLPTGPRLEAEFYVPPHERPLPPEPENAAPTATRPNAPANETEAQAETRGEVGTDSTGN